MSSPARRDVRGDEHFVFTVAKTLQRLLALLLRAVGMQHTNGVIGALERVGHAVGTVLGAAENDDGLVIHARSSSSSSRSVFCVRRTRDRWM